MWFCTVCFFVFKQKTAYEMRISDGSSDVCSSDRRVGEGFTLGPVAITSIEGIRRTALIQPGSLYESKYRIRIAPGADARATGKALKGAFPAAGFEIKDRDRAAPGTSRVFDRMGQFLSLDRKSVVSGQSVSVRVAPGGRRTIKNNKRTLA